jgi:predicted permease
LEAVAQSLVEDGRREAGVRGELRAWGLLLVDVVRTLPAEWLEEIRRSIGGRGAAGRGIVGEPGWPAPGGASPGEPEGFGSGRAERRLVVDGWRREFRQALRRLRRSPGFAAGAIVTLALGIGANTAVFSVVNAVLLRPLPYANSEALVVLNETRAGDEISVSYPDLEDWRARTRTLEGPAGYVAGSFTLTGEGPAERVTGQFVTADLFALLGVEPAYGRVFEASSDGRGAAREVVLGYGLWQRDFGGDPGAIGRIVHLNGEPYEVLGVMPPGFEFPGGLVWGPAELWVPMGLAVDEMMERSSHPGLYAIGRLREGTGLEAVRADMAGIAASLAAEHPETNERIGVQVETAIGELVGSARPALLALLGSVGLVLLIACANVANLLVVRSTGRRREMRVRAALGASRGGLLAPALMESAILAFGGGAAGVLLARWMTGAGGVLLGGLPRADSVPLDASVLTFSAGATALALLLFGLAPAVHVIRSQSSLWLGSRGEGREARRLRVGLVVAELALALVVLVGAGLLGRSFMTLLDRDPGIDPEGSFAFYLQLPEAEYGEGDPVRAFYGELLDGLRGLPGVTAVGGISTLPFSGSGSQSRFATGSRPDLEPHRSDVAVVMPGYFRSLGVERVAGRVFGEADRPGSTPVVVVDERLANLFWPGADAVGERITGWGLQDAEVVGVVRHVRNYGVANESREEVFMPHSQRSYYAMWVTVRASVDAASLLGPIRDVVANLDPGVPVERIIRMPELVAARVATPRVSATLAAGFALLALVLCSVGVYGVTAVSVTQRTREIGTRVALGAGSRDVVAMIVRQGAKLAGAGIAIGLPLALAATGLIRNQIQVSRTDPATFLVLPVALFGIALLAAWLPARRAAGISPLEALREE